jgi:hypothetical protein
MKGMVVRLVWFALGVCVGVLIVLKGSLWIRPQHSVSAKIFTDTNVNDLITINTGDDITRKRTELIAFIWGPQGFPSSLPEKVESSIADSRYSKLKNLKQIDRLTIPMDWGLVSIGYHFIPVSGNNKLLIFQGGHDGDFISGIEVIRSFLEKGFSVIALSMPLEDPNTRPVVELKRIGKIQLTFHDQLKLLEMKSGHPIQLFLTPIAVSLNYANNFSYDSAYMTGVSGGGWTTTLYAALDPRITRSYPVAGSLPLYLREDRNRINTAHRSADWGDYEQTIPELYSIANYLELYILSSQGPRRKQLQILNEYDPCCFAGESSKTYEATVNSRVQQVGGGRFAVFLDKTNREHSISNDAINVMLADINTAN